MATYSSILAWKIPWTEEPGWLHSMGSQKSGLCQLSTATTDVILGALSFFLLDCILLKIILY